MKVNLKLNLNKNLMVRLIDAELERQKTNPAQDLGDLVQMRFLNELRETLVAPTPTGLQLYNQGGAWLAVAREWIQQKAINGSDVTWGSNQPLRFASLCSWDIEVLAAQVAAAAYRDQGTYVDRGEVVRPKSHYDWLDEHFVPFLKAVLPEGKKEVAESLKGMISAHGDKCYQYKYLWKDAGIPFEHGVAIYLLSYVYPWSSMVRQTTSGWVLPDEWVIATYPSVKDKLPPALTV